ncbi:serine hydrolase [Flavobacteriaceae bacterium F08102]|nr:serine hydrolase [Flavobacteriaceae bacterium F08102]
MKNYVILFLINIVFAPACTGSDDDLLTDSSSIFSESQLLNAANYAKENGGSAVLIAENGEIIFEDYQNGADQYTAPHIYSATKFFWASVAALAKQQNLINYEELVANTITEWQDATIHPGKDQIKIKDLLTLSSGLSQNFIAFSNADNTYQYAIDELSMVNTPGTKFSYGPSNYYVFGALLDKKLKEQHSSLNPLTYLETEIFEKIGLTYESWTHDLSGNPNIPNGCSLTPRNWLKYGQFILNKGFWNNEQIIQSDLLAEQFVATGPNPGHGNFAWLNRKEGYGFNTNDMAPSGSTGGFIYHHGFVEIIGGLGAGKNRMYLIPSLNVVIIRQTLQENDNFEDSEFLEILLGDLD